MYVAVFCVLNLNSSNILHSFCMFLGSTEHFEDAFEKTNPHPGGVALAFYSGLYTYAGWYTQCLTAQMFCTHLVLLYVRNMTIWRKCIRNYYLYSY